MDNWEMNPAQKERVHQDYLELQSKLANDPAHLERRKRQKEHGKRLSCVYRIVCFRNGRVYVGCTNNFKSRKTQHLTNLRNGKASIEIQRDFNEYGESAFFFEILEGNIAVENRDSTEAKWMDFYKSYETGYNIKFFFTDASKEYNIKRHTWMWDHPTCKVCKERVWNADMMYWNICKKCYYSKQQQEWDKLSDSIRAVVETIG